MPITTHEASRYHFEHSRIPGRWAEGMTGLVFVILGLASLICKFWAHHNHINQNYTLHSGTDDLRVACLSLSLFIIGLGGVMMMQAGFGKLGRRT